MVGADVREQFKLLSYITCLFSVIQETSSSGFYAVIGGMAGVIAVLIISVVILKRKKGNM
jgi:hypothetical protein